MWTRLGAATGALLLFPLPPSSMQPVVGHLPDVGSRVQGRRLASAARDSLSAAAAACFTPGKCRTEFYRAPVRSGDSWMPAHTLLVEFRVLHALVLSQVGLS